MLTTLPAIRDIFWMYCKIQLIISHLNDLTIDPQIHLALEFRLRVHNCSHQLPMSDLWCRMLIGGRSASLVHIEQSTMNYGEWMAASHGFSFGRTRVIADRGPWKRKTQFQNKFFYPFFKTPELVAICLPQHPLKKKNWNPDEIRRTWSN